MSDAVTVERIEGDAALCLRLTGVIDERFEAGAVFRELAPHVLLDLAGIRRITSFGVRQWSDAMKALPTRVQHLYILRAPACFVDQLNMVLNFGGRAEVVTATALYFCDRCQEERQVAIDVLGEHALLASGAAPAAPCPTCGTPMALEEDPQQAFRYVTSYGARTLAPAAVPLLAETSLYLPRRIGPPPEEWKLIHGDVTLLVLSGTLDQRFRPRRLSSGVEGNVVVDVGRVSSADATGLERFRQLLLALEEAGPVTLVDVPEALLREIASGALPLGRTQLWSALLAFSCASCGAELRKAVRHADGASHRPRCERCGEPTMLAGAGPWLERAFRTPEPIPTSPAVETLIAQRDELVSRARAESGARAETPTHTLGRYRVLRPLSRGGMAEILLAVHEGIGGFEKLIALKKIRRKLLERRHVAIELFLNEAKIVANLNHPNIVQTFEVGEHGGDLFIAMEYVHGVDARTVVKKRIESRAVGITLALPHILYIGTQVAAALEHAHTARDLARRPLHIVHRDVSLSNVVLGFDGQVKLVDFGIATAASVEVPNSSSDGLIGKLSYMSPEQVAKLPVDGRSDIFSLGIALFELITSKPLFRRTTDDETLKAVLNDPVPPLAPFGVPPDTEAVLLRALERDRDKRYASAHEFEIALQNELQRHGGMSAHALSLRMREMFPDQSAAAPTANPEPGAPFLPLPESDSGPSHSRRSMTFGPDDIPHREEPSQVTKLVPDDVVMTPAVQMRAIDADSGQLALVPGVEEAPERRPGSGVHFNRAPRMPEYSKPMPMGMPTNDQASPAAAAPTSITKIALIVVLLLMAIGLLLTLFLRG